MYCTFVIIHFSLSFFLFLSLSLSHLIFDTQNRKDCCQEHLPTFQILPHPRNSTHPVVWKNAAAANGCNNNSNNNWVAYADKNSIESI